MSGCQTSSSRHSRASHPPTPLGVSWVCSLTSPRCGTTIGYMLFGTGFPRTLRRTRALSILVAGLATTMLSGPQGLQGLQAQGAASRKETEAWRAKHEADYRRDYVPLAGLFDLKRGANTAGSAASNNIVLPKSAPAVIGRFVLDGQNVRFEPQPGAGVTLKGRPLTSGVALRSDAAEEADELAVGDITLWVHISGERPTVRMRDPNGETARSFSGFQWFPIDDSYRVTARFIKDPAPREVRAPNQLGDIDVMQSEGVVEFRLNGQTVRLRPMTTQAEAVLVHLPRRHERQGNIRDRPIPVLGSPGRWNHGARLQPGVQSAVRLQSVYNLSDSPARESPEGAYPRRRKSLRGRQVATLKAQVSSERRVLET